MPAKFYQKPFSHLAVMQKRADRHREKHTYIHFPSYRLDIILYLPINASVIELRTAKELHFFIMMPSLMIGGDVGVCLQEEVQRCGA